MIEFVPDVLRLHPARLHTCRNELRRRQPRIHRLRGLRLVTGRRPRLLHIRQKMQHRQCLHPHPHSHLVNPQGFPPITDLKQPRPHRILLQLPAELPPQPLKAPRKIPHLLKPVPQRHKRHIRQMHPRRRRKMLNPIPIPQRRPRLPRKVKARHRLKRRVHQHMRQPVRLPPDQRHRRMQQRTHRLPPSRNARNQPRLGIRHHLPHLLKYERRRQIILLRRHNVRQSLEHPRLPVPLANDPRRLRHQFVIPRPHRRPQTLPRRQPPEPRHRREQLLPNPLRTHHRRNEYHPPRQHPPPLPSQRPHRLRHHSRRQPSHS